MISGLALRMTLTVFCCVVCASFVSASDYTTSSDGAGGLVITGYTGSETELVIPQTIGGQTVTRIGDMAFFPGFPQPGAPVTSLTSITFPDGLISIGDFALFSNTELINVSIPEGVTSIGDSAFNTCSKLPAIHLPDSITSIGEGAFANCSKLASIIIPSKVTEIADGTFLGCTELSEVEIPDGVTNIGNAAFKNCGSLISITIPESVTSIEAEAFFFCYKLIIVYFEGNAPSIPEPDGGISPSAVFYDLNESGNEEDVIFYYEIGTTGWGATFDSWPTQLRSPTYDRWISLYPGVGNQTGLSDDPDGDGRSNAVESFFGTDPSVASGGALVVTDVRQESMTFSHPKSALGVRDLDVSYEWSTDLVNFYAEGEPDQSFLTVFFLETIGEVTGTAMVEAIVEGDNDSGNFFVRLVVAASAP